MKLEALAFLCCPCNGQELQLSMSCMQLHEESQVVDCLTVSLHNPNSRQFLPAVRPVQGTVSGLLKNGRNSHRSCDPKMHCDLSRIHYSFMTKSIIKLANQTKPFRNHISNPIENPTATMLKLYSSLAQYCMPTANVSQPTSNCKTRTIERLATFITITRTLETKAMFNEN